MFNIPTLLFFNGQLFSEILCQSCSTDCTLKFSKIRICTLSLHWVIPLILYVAMWHFHPLSFSFYRGGSSDRNMPICYTTLSGWVHSLEVFFSFVVFIVVAAVVFFFLLLLSGWRFYYLSVFRSIFQKRSKPSSMENAVFFFPYTSE